ncbi:hypothetical protein BSKO_05089 [Bryopsis sp. KO-2023]|nr:hypothetical protein BSKO_05089 [Bryopsis sp. KO-2023]
MELGSKSFLRRVRDPSSFRRGRNPVGCAKDPHQAYKSNMNLRKELSEVEVTLKAKECELESLHRRADLYRWTKLQNAKDQVTYGETRKESVKRFMGQHSRPSRSQTSSNPPPEYVVGKVKNVCHHLNNTDGLHGAQHGRIPDENSGAHAKTCDKEVGVSSRSPMTDSNRSNDSEIRGDGSGWRIRSHPVPRQSSIEEELQASDLVEESTEAQSWSSVCEEPVVVKDAEVQTGKLETCCPQEMRLMEVEMQAKITKLEAELTVEECMRREAAAETVRLQEEKASDQELIGALREEVARRVEREGQLSQAVDRKLEEVEAVKGDYGRICEEVDHLEKFQVRPLKDQLTKIAGERNRLEKELGESRSAMLNLRAERDKLKGEKEALLQFAKEDEEDHQLVLRTRNQLLHQLETLQTDLEDAKATTEKVEAVSTQKDNEMATLRQQLADVTPIPEAQELLAAKAKEMEETVGRLKDELQKKQTALDQSVTLQQKLLKNADRNPRVFSGLLEEENEMLKQKLIECDMEMDEMKESHQKKASAYEAVDENIACLEADIEQWRRDYEGCTEARARLQQENDSMKEELRKLAIECEGSPAKRVRDLKQKLAQERQQSEVDSSNLARGFLASRGCWYYLRHAGELRAAPIAMTTPSRRLLEVFTKEDTPEPQTPLPPTATLAKLSAPNAGALRGEVSNTPIRFRHSLHDAKTPKLSQGFLGSDFGGSKTVNPSSRLGGDFETLTENVRGPQFETIQEERAGLDLVAEIDHPEDGVSEEGGFLEEEAVERHEFEQWIHQRAAKFGRSYDQMLEEMGEEAVAFAYQTKRQKEIMQEVETEEKRKLLEDIEMRMPCEVVQIHFRKRRRKKNKCVMVFCHDLEKRRKLSLSDVGLAYRKFEE